MFKLGTWTDKSKILELKKKIPDHQYIEDKRIPSNTCEGKEFMFRSVI